MEIRINPSLDPVALHAELVTSGRIHVPDFFAPQTADYLYGLLQSHQDWYITYNEGRENFETPLAEFQALDATARRQFMGQILARARDGFQFVFRQYYISRSVERGENPGHPLHAVHEFINSESTLEWMRALIGTGEVRKADSYASLYAPGDFLTIHDDLHGSHDRVAAFVVSMTRGWNPDWGGYLAFFDERDNITEAFMPGFNILNLFLVPRRHAVQMVSPFAATMRTSLLGWLHR